MGNGRGKERECTDSREKEPLEFQLSAFNFQLLYLVLLLSITRTDPPGLTCANAELAYGEQ